MITHKQRKKEQTKLKRIRKVELKRDIDFFATNKNYLRKLDESGKLLK